MEDVGIFCHLYYFRPIGLHIFLPFGIFCKQLSIFRPFWSIFRPFWSIFRPFGIFYCYLVYFMVIWYILWPIGILMVIWYIFTILVCYTVKNLANLAATSS
jgi:hypothetical protein